MGWFKGIMSGVILLSLSTQVEAGDARQLVIVKSSDNAYFEQTIETLFNHVDQAVRYRMIMADQVASLESAGAAGRLYVALGQKAVQAVAAQGSKAAVINAYLTEEQYLELKIDRRHTSVLLDQPLPRYLAFCKFILKIDSIGMLSTRESDPDLEKMPILRKVDLDVKQYRIDDKNKLLPVLRQLLRENDALLMLPRQAIYNRESLKGVLLTSYRTSKPVISYSPAHVKSGALASIFSSPVDIGRHLALLTNQHLHGAKKSGPAFEYARFYSINTNPRVARALGLSLPSIEKLREQLDELGS